MFISLFPPFNLTNDVLHNIQLVLQRHMAHRVIDVIVRRMRAVMRSLEHAQAHVPRDGVGTVVKLFI